MTESTFYILVVSHNIYKCNNDNYKFYSSGYIYNNIFLNVSTMLLVSLSNYLKINEKCEILKINRDKFIKLYNLIEKRKYTEDISIDFIDIVITNYDNIIENINFSFPLFILRRIRTTYAQKKTLPLFINGIKKLDRYRGDNGIIELDLESS